MIKTINSWRGLMAVVVVSFHSGLGYLWNLTYSGVTFFFISSAFLLSARHPFDRLTKSDYKNFVFGHSMRLYPLNWLALGLMIALALGFHTASVDWGATALTALLLQSWSPVHDVHYGLNPVAWFMSALLFCYVAYPFLAYWVGRLRFWPKAILTAVMVLVLGLMLVPLDAEGRETMFVNPLVHVVDFTVGILLYHVYKILKNKNLKIGFGTATLVEVALLILLALTVVATVKTTWFKPWEDDLLWLLPQGAILVALTLFDGREGAVGRVLLWKPLQWLGSISYEVFMLQFVAFHLFNYVLSPVAGHFGVLIYDLKTLCVWLVLLPLAWVVNRYFTRPISAYFKRRIK